MKKLLLFICILFMGFTTFSNAEASSIIFKRNVASVQVGKTFTIPVIIDPTGTAQYTASLFLTFAPSMLEVTSFTFGENWIALSQSGFDSVDNIRGELIKTAGFPRGFSQPTSLGNITFRAKKAGEITISADAQSFVLDGQNNNSLQSRPQLRIIVEQGSVPQAPSTTPTAPLPSPSPVENNILNITPTPERNANSQTATLQALLFIAFVLLLCFIGRAIYPKSRNRPYSKNKNDKNFKN